jgi:hypothetical protein
LECEREKRLWKGPSRRVPKYVYKNEISN